MTVYTDTEASPHDGAPVEGYTFTGTFQTYRYTSADQNETIGGFVYTAIPIERDVVRSGTQNDDSLDLELTLPANIQMVLDYAYSVSPPDLVLEIFRYHRGTNPATDWAKIWKGPVTGFSVSGEEAKIQVPSIFSIALSAEVPSVYSHNPCNHVLYDSRCGVAKDALTQKITTVTAIVDENTITVADDGFADNYLRAGEIINLTRGERRMITDNVADDISFAFPFYDIQVGDSIELLVGCDHVYSTCKTKFNNGPKFTGFPFTPGDNPFQGEL